MRITGTLGLCTAAVVSWMGLVTASAAQTVELDAAQRAIAQMTCKDGAPSNAADTVIALLSSYADRPVEVLSNAANVTLKDFVLDGGRLSRVSDGAVFANRILVANRATYDAMMRSIARDGAALCPIFEVVARKGLQATMDLQENTRAYYRPHAALAQVALNVHGCGAGLADGLFGPGSRAAWAQSGRAELPDGGVPTPADLVALWRDLDQGMKCRDVKTDLSPLRETIEACLRGRTSDVSTPRLGWALAKATAQSPQATGPLLSELLLMCRDVYLREDASNFSGLQSETLFRSWLAALPDLKGSDAQAVAQGMIDATTPDRPGGELGRNAPKDPIKIAPLLAEIATDLFLGDAGMEKRTELAAHLLNAAIPPNTYGGGSGENILRGIRSGVLGADFSEATRTTLAHETPENGRQTNLVLPQDPVAVVRQLLEQGGQWGEPILTPYEGAPRTSLGGATVGFGTDIGGVNLAVALADAVQSSTDASDLLATQGSAAINSGVAVLLFEGNTQAGADLSLAKRHFKAAAAQSGSYAVFRLALMAEADGALPAAITLYDQAVQMGQPAAAMRLAELALAGRHGADESQIRDWLRLAVGLKSGRLINGAADPLLALIRLYPQNAITGPLADVLAELAEVSTERNADLPYGEANLARDLGDGFAGLKEGTRIDPRQAAFWYRRAGRDGETPLVRLLAADPSLMLHAREIDALADRSLLALYLKAPTPSAFLAVLDDSCPTDNSTADCVAFMAEAALGALPGQQGGTLLTRAFEWLDNAAAAERAAWIAPRTAVVETWDNRAPNSIASFAFARVLGFYGDYQEARTALSPIQSFWYVDSTGDVLRDITDGAFRRAAVRFVSGKERAGWAPVEALLQDLAQRGDDRADAILELARAQSAPQSGTLNLAQAREAFDLTEPLFPARGLSAAARRLSLLEQDTGNILRAAELEMRAFSADLARHRATELRLGALHATMGRVCSYSRASERLYELDQRDVALILAKQAVNDLQALRARLRGLPEKLQMCFRDSVAGHYRWLASLFIAQDRPAEATAVLQMLKSFETFEFLGKDEAYRGISLDQLPLTAAESDLLTTLQSSSEPSITSIALERRSLLLARRDNTLTSEQDLRLAALNTRLAQERTRRETALGAIAASAKEANRAARIDALDDGKSIKSLLTRAYGGTAAALHYVVLPDTMGAVLTTPFAERVFTWDRLGDAPFSEAALNQRIDTLRASLRTPTTDPRELAKAMHDLLMPTELRRELTDAGIETLLVSPDRHLRYLPFAALHDGDQFLVEGFDILNVTEAPGGASTLPSPEMAAFGTTRAWHGFSPLPGVKRELEALIGADGMFAGAPRLDDDFTRDRLASSLVFDQGAGILHLASHFKLSQTEDSSFLLLGDGAQLSVRDIRDGFGIDLDFSEVSLLTLSACETGFGGAGADGRELESFAAIAQDQGAATVVATLWPVADKSTATFMALFYGAMAQAQMAPRHALSAAQRAFLAGANSAIAPEASRGAVALIEQNEGLGAKHPFYWAPFVALEGAS